jgi:hypothetical protein
MVKTQYPDAIIQEWQFDRGGEFTSKVAEEFLAKNGIKALYSVPEMHQQNGRAERFIRTIMDKAQAMRLDTYLPQSYWEFAVDYAVHVYNRTPLNRLKWITPYEFVDKKVPDVGHLRVFGSGAYVFLPENRRPNKLSSKSEIMIFIGLSEGTKGWKFLCIKS